MAWHSKNKRSSEEYCACHYRVQHCLFINQHNIVERVMNPAPARHAKACEFDKDLCHLKHQKPSGFGPFCKIEGHLGLGTFFAENVFGPFWIWAILRSRILCSPEAHHYYIIYGGCQSLKSLKVTISNADIWYPSLSALRTRIQMKIRRSDATKKQLCRFARLWQTFHSARN